MSDDAPMKKSFSSWRRWGFAVNLVVRTALVLAVVVMVNYLGARWFHRLNLNAATRQPLSPQTVGLLKSLTNHVKVTLFYDRDDPLYTTVAALLNEYRDANNRIHVATVDYLRDAGLAEKIKRDYKNLFNSSTNKDMVIFDCDGHPPKRIVGRALAQIVTEQVPNPKEIELRKHTLFHGERLFTAALLAVTSNKPLQAYYLTGHGEHQPDGGDEVGYRTFTSVLAQNFVQLTTLSLLGSNAVPTNCNLLLIAGPLSPLSDGERERIDDYLHQGGRLFALINFASLDRPTGMEKVLAGWGVDVGDQTIKDPQNTTGHSDVIAFIEQPVHPIVAPLASSALQFVLPRAVGPLDVGTPPLDAPRVVVIASSSGKATAGKLGPKRFPLAVAIEKGNVKGVITERGSTRIVAVGDSFFLDNQMIEAAGNRDFLGYTINWLLERTQLMQGLGPRPVAEFRLALTDAQFHSVVWLLLAIIPGAVLAFGALVWLRRRR